mmetsp:Transcript_40672/g.73278  ORF Transcript_40672/g.73278 Transcript_40672/m.73278 type:complete len:229 (+) Transcript_40672:41-727(+)
MQPRTRVERHASLHKDALEKARLRHRTGGFFRYEDVQNPTAVAVNCPSYLDRRAWMTAGWSCEELKYAEREQMKILRDEKTEMRRARSYAREVDRLYATDANERLKDEQAKRMRADPMIGRKNVSGQSGFNLMTQEYDNSPAGAMLKHHDDLIRYKGKVRSANLALRSHLGFNPVVGEQIYSFSLPPPPRPPWAEDDDVQSMRSKRSQSSSTAGRASTWSQGWRPRPA